MKKTNDDFIRPEGFLCPFCGEFHTWQEKTSKHEIGMIIYQNYCPTVKALYSKGLSYAYGRYEFFYFDNQFFYYIESWCSLIFTSITGSIYIKDLTIDENSNTVSLSFPLECRNNLGLKSCIEFCYFNKHCSLLKSVNSKNTLYTTLNIGFSYSTDEFIKFLDTYNYS